ncbi:EamA family transporter [Nocardia sp. CWNU-33]|uniref:EamA family transporter n=1 Tax=Nocardia sp. CWNU-33 TaxID=3392117 RepID=UPI00398E3C59
MARSGRSSGHYLALGALVLSGVSFQVGAAVGVLLFPAIGFLAVVGLRLVFGAPILWMVGRPRLGSLTRSDLMTAATFGIVSGAMSLSLFAAVERIGLGVAVTIEFTGPLAVSLLTSRRWLNGCCAVIAAGAVCALTGLSGKVDPMGCALGFVAAGLWASSILLSSRMGSTIPGRQGPAVAVAAAAVCFAPVALIHAGRGLADPGILLLGFCAAILATVVPQLLELFAIRRLSRGEYGNLMALYPAIAGIVGVLVLREDLSPSQWTAIATISAVSCIVTISADRRARMPRGMESGDSRTAPLAAVSE